MSTLLQRLDAEITIFTDNFANLIKASRVNTPDDSTTKGARVADDLLEVLAEKMVLSGQNLISMIAELKQNAVVSNFALLNQNIAQQDAIHHKTNEALQTQLGPLQHQLRQVSKRV
ncbi:hypothetical protein WJX79_004137 [Trebouxia sp. C0005]|nr:MAG: hypothetical protein FRX49_04103 [Trebouxia sp. A1-2]